MSRYQFKLDPKTGTLSEDDSKKYFSTVGLAIFLFMFASSLISFTALLLLTRFAPALLENAVVTNGLSMIIQYGIALPIALVALKKLPKDTNPSEQLGVKGFLGVICVAFTFMSVGGTVADLMTGAIELLSGRSLTNPVESAAYGESFLVNLIFLAILAPVIEELVFRKLICDRLLPLGEGYAVVLSAAVFALIHGNLFQFFYAFLTGMLFSYVYIKTGRVRYTISIHVLINFLGAVLLPWAIEKLAPILTEETYERLNEALTIGDPATMEALAEELSPYMLPVLLYSGYEILFTVLSIAGVFIFFNNVKKIKLRGGLLPPAKEGRIANIFCNGGVALAIATFAVIFVGSLV